MIFIVSHLVQLVNALVPHITSLVMEIRIRSIVLKVRKQTIKPKQVKALQIVPLTTTETVTMLVLIKILFLVSASSNLSIHFSTWNSRTFRSQFLKDPNQDNKIHETLMYQTFTNLHWGDSMHISCRRSIYNDLDRI